MIDDWGLSPLTEPQRRDILEVIDDRHGSRSTVVAGQLPVEKWHDYLGDPTIADAVLDPQVDSGVFVDPSIIDDPDAKFVQEITLSYTFHETPLPEENQAALDPSAADDATAVN